MLFLIFLDNLYEAPRACETVYEDLFIRKFMFGTWHGLFASEVIIKRRHNMVILAGIVHQRVNPRKLYFLIGYTEELLSRFLKRIVKIELQSVKDRKDMIFKFIWHVQCCRDVLLRVVLKTTKFKHWYLGITYSSVHFMWHFVWIKRECYSFMEMEVYKTLNKHWCTLFIMSCLVTSTVVSRMKCELWMHDWYLL